MNNKLNNELFKWNKQFPRPHTNHYTKHLPEVLGRHVLHDKRLSCELLKTLSELASQTSVGSVS